MIYLEPRDTLKTLSDTWTGTGTVPSLMRILLATCFFVPSVLTFSCQAGVFSPVLSQGKSVDVVAALRNHVWYRTYLDHEDLAGGNAVFPAFESEPDCNYRITLQSQFQEGAATLTFVGNDSSVVCFMVDVGPPTTAARRGDNSIEPICDTAGSSAGGANTSEAISSQFTSTRATSVSDSAQNPQTGTAPTSMNTTATNAPASPNQTFSTTTSKGSTSLTTPPGSTSSGNLTDTTSSSRPTGSSTTSGSDSTDLPTSTPDCTCSS